MRARVGQATWLFSILFLSEAPGNLPLALTSLFSPLMETADPRKAARPARRRSSERSSGSVLVLLRAESVAIVLSSARNRFPVADKTDDLSSLGFAPGESPGALVVE